MSDNQPIHVRRLLITPIKGLRVTPREELMLERGGVRENRRFYLVDERGVMVNGKQMGELSELIAEYAEDERSLSVTLPGGERICGPVSTGPEIEARFFGMSLRAPIVLGPWSEAISTYVSRSLRLVAADPARKGVDRGERGAVSLVSRGSLDRLTAVAGNGGEVDPRRFRMLVEIDGIDPHDEDAWVGRRVRIGDALVGFNGHVGRCLVTSRHPDTGTIDLPTLDLLREYRGDEPTTEPLPFGIYGEVIEPGAVRLGDPVSMGAE
ncbi:MAG TPA: MOSC N-terminal beta barrel domain-containing protein [Solirubrobacteraceae bacterium]|nr:MOSC N-terminal beta barrel domain-containing protein [Solirubrobacteraceae bacterium]